MKLSKIIKRILINIKASQLGNIFGVQYYIGIARLVNPIELRQGLGVITPDGYGNIRGFWGRSSEFVTVEVMLHRKHQKSYRRSELKQFVVFNFNFGQLIEISTACFPVLYKDGQIIEYRITRRKKAMLSDWCLNEYNYVKIFSGIKHGRGRLKLLESNGYLIIKKNVKKKSNTPRRYQLLGRLGIVYLRKKN